MWQHSKEGLTLLVHTSIPPFKTIFKTSLNNKRMNGIEQTMRNLIRNRGLSPDELLNEAAQAMAVDS
jgi:hypothetical protein